MCRAMSRSRAQLVIATRSSQRRQLSADLALRQFEEQGGQRLFHLLQIVERHQLVRRTDQHAVQAVQQLVGFLFVNLQMAGRVKGHVF